ncbi:MAG: hypothetical protein OXP66_18445 [Candidatus Tectomicrobia bacterium]|nr:hypothetical protein [Candidatus Tectomicrobia bacterium]
MIRSEQGRRTISRRRLAAAAVVLGFLTTVYPALTPVPETHAQSQSDWRLNVNRRVFTARSWNWVLRFVEKKGDQLTLGVAYKNNASSPRPIFLAEGFETSTLLTDAAAATYPMLSVSGISGDPTKVGRLKLKTALFTFPYPAGAAEVTFSSVWITVWMMNAASRIHVEFPVRLPQD